MFNDIYFSDKHKILKRRYNTVTLIVVKQTRKFDCIIPPASNITYVYDIEKLYSSQGNYFTYNIKKSIESCIEKLKKNNIDREIVIFTGEKNGNYYLSVHGEMDISGVCENERILIVRDYPIDLDYLLPLARYYNGSWYYYVSYHHGEECPEEPGKVRSYVLYDTNKIQVDCPY